MQTLELEIKGLKPISKQKGTKMMGFVNKSTNRYMPRGYLSAEYKTLTKQVGLMAKIQCVQHGWALTKEELFADCLLVVPPGFRRPDIVDNALSAFFDALHGIVYHNDQQITKCMMESQRGDWDWYVKMAFCLRSEYDQMYEGMVGGND